MRYILFTLSLLFTFSSFAQIGQAEEVVENTVVGEVSLLTLGRMGDLNGTASITVTDTSNDDGKNYHMLAFQNQKYKTITDIKVAGFFADNSDLDYLFNEMVKVLKTGDEVNIPVGNNTFYISRMDLSKTAIIMLQVSGDDSGYLLLGDQQLFVLFGKTDEWNKDEWSKKAYKGYMN